MALTLTVARSLCSPKEARCAAVRLLALALGLAPVPAFASPTPPREAPPSNAASVSEAALVGHYYLSGVMEAGSELLLKPDGTFEWFLSYGAMDQFARGRWSRTGERVTLTADAADESRPLFAFRGLQPWDAAMEQRLAAGTRAAGEGCPGTDAPVVEDVPPLAVPAKEEEATAPADAPLTWSAPSRHPSSCSVDSPPEVDLPPEKWTRGLAVRIFDEAYEQGAKDVSVTLLLANGERETLKTDSQGVAIHPGILKSPVTRVALSASHAPGRDVVLSVPAGTSGILSMSIDIAQLIALPFTTLRLRVDGNDLVPEGLGGRYIRPR